MAKQGCSHEGCDEALPEDESKIPAGWTVARVEEYKVQTISRYFVYLCPRHTLVTTEKQASLFEEASPT